MTLSKRLALFALFSSSYLTNIPAFAELRPMAEDELSNVVGQAYVQVDNIQHPTNKNIDYVRAQFGYDIETQVSANELELGKYPRWDEKRNDWEPQKSDIHIKDFAMGHIYDETYYTTNPLIPVPKKPDGSAYENGEMVPFRISDPYLEFAFETINGEPTPVGMRIGYGKAEGTLSGTILSLTGNVESTIKTNANFLANQVGACDLSPELCQSLGLDPLLGSVELENQAYLVYGKDNAPAELVGEIDEARASYTGMKNGDTLNAHTPLTSIGLEAQNCQVVAADVCFPLSQFQTLWIGKRDQYGNLDGGAEGMFLSFQTDALEWQRDIHQEATAENFMQTVQGAFMNLPTGAQEIDHAHATLGTQRVRTEYIDRGVGLF